MSKLAFLAIFWVIRVTVRRFVCASVCTCVRTYVPTFFNCIKRGNREALISRGLIRRVPGDPKHQRKTTSTMMEDDLTQKQRRPNPKTKTT